MGQSWISARQIPQKCAHFISFPHLYHHVLSINTGYCTVSFIRHVDPAVKAGSLYLVADLAAGGPKVRGIPASDSVSATAARKVNKALALPSPIKQ